MSAISFIIPIFNESEILESQLRPFLSELKHSSWNYEVVVVDDGSEDNSFSLLQSLQKDFPELITLRHAKNTGIGGSYRTGIHHASKEFIMLLAIDLTLTREYLQPFLNALGKADVLVGIRIQREGYSCLMQFNSFIYQRMVNLLFKLPLKDVNWIACYRHTYLKNISIECQGIVMMLEILLKLRDQQATFAQIPVTQPKRPGHKTPSAARFSIMLKTLFQFIGFYYRYTFKRSRSSL